MATLFTILKVAAVVALILAGLALRSIGPFGRRW